MPKKEAVPAFTPLAVVGVGGVFPKAGTIKQFWANIKNKVDAIGDVPATHWSKDEYYDPTKKGTDTVYACKGGFLDQYDFDPSEFGLAPNTLEATDPAQLFGLVAAKMALADAGYPVDQETWDRSRVSTILGVTGTLEIVIPLGARLSHPRWRKALDEAGVPKAQADDVVARMADSYVPWQEASFPGLLGNVVSGRIANRFNLGGTNCTVDAACGSSLSALHMASLELQTGRAKMVVTGGVDTFNDIFMYTCFTKTPALSPGGHAKPFDAKADGTTLGEGIGMVVLKRLDDAVADGDRVIAVLRGIGSSSDGRGKSIYAPSAGGQTRALEEAYRVSGVAPETVELVEAHGTGTAVGDGIEVEALAGVYKKDAKRSGAWCALGSVKSMVGHTKAAAGAAAFVKAAMALRHKTFPPTLKVTEPHPVLAKGDTPFYLSLEKRPWMAPAGHPRRAACSALGFGGTNFHAVLEEASSAKTETDWDGEHELFAGLDVAPLLAAKNWDEVRLACHASRKAFDPSAPQRLLLVLERGGDWKAVAEKAKARKTSPLDGVFYGEGKPGKLAVLFPGQGSQYVGMSRDLVCAFPEAFDALAEADAAYDEGRLSDAMFPRPTLKAEEKDAQEKALRDTSVAQPALGAAALSAWRVLTRFGVKADAAAGHSYGELVALHVAGRYDAQTLHVLSRLRGKLMKGDGSDKGSMLAVVATFDDVAKAVAEEGLDLVIANRNAPTQNVLSGKTSEIEKAQERLAKRGLKCVRLPVAAAFHSALVEPALKPFGAALEKVAFAKPSIPVYANSTGAPYPDAPKASRELLAGQLGKPVEFVKLVSNMAADGVTTVVECGAGGRLTGLVNQIAPTVNAVAVDASNGKKNGIADLAKVLAQLAALGHAVDLKGWQGGDAGVKDARPKPKLSVALTGATYRSTPKKKFEKKLTKGPGTELTFQPAASASATMTASDPSILGQALAAAQSSIEALNRLQEQTAALHLQFLQSQEASQRHIQTLVEQQQAVVARLSGGAPLPVIAMPAHVPPPIAAAPVVVPERVIHKTPQRSSVDKSGSTQGVLPVLLGIVADKTGYPADTLNPDMDLEADLGIDSIKRVEILSAVREKLPGAPQVKPEHLGTLRTLRSIADYLSDGMTASATAAPISSDSAPKSDVLPVLLGIVADKTGYPADTLNPDMDLEGDLGIDSIKRVEILSAVREKLPSAPQVKPEHLGTLRTLRSIADYLSNGMTASATAAPISSDSASESDVLPVLLGIVADKTGYPADTLNPDMDLEGDLGIDSIKRVEILSAVREKLPGAPQVKPEHLGTLRTLRSIADYLSAAPKSVAVSVESEVPLTKVPVPSVRLVRSVPVLVPVGPRDVFPLKGVAIAVTKDSGLDQALAAELKGKGLDAAVVSLDRPEDLPADLGALVIVAPARAAGEGCPWTAESEAWLKKAFLLAQAAGRSFAARKTRGLLATVTRLDGGFGLLGGAASDPSFGGLAGLVKTAAREWPGVVCRAIDVDPALPLPTAASMLAKELGYEAPVEAALTAAGVKTVVLEERPAVPVAGEPLAPGDVVIVTGGARGVTAECAVALAAAFKPKLVLVGRSPLPGAEDAAYASARTEGEVRAAVAAAHKGLAPKAIGEKAKELLAAREIRATLARLEALGVEARYRACDARDAAAVKALVAGTVEDLGPVRGLVHGAGVLADKALLEKTPAMLDAVLDAKLAGLRHFLDAVELPKLKALALFSSSTARYGRVGQSDYATANEALNKAARLLAERLPSCRVASVGWGPWDGGMVDKNLKALFAAEGVGVIGLAEGGAHLVAELRGPAPESVVIAELPGKAEDLPVVFERSLTLEDAPVLKDHAFAGRAVLPFALSAEWLAHAALHANPGLSFLGFDDLRVVRGVFVLPGKATAVTVRAGAARKQGDESVVSAELRGADGALHVSARVILGSRRPQAPAAALKASGPAYKGGVARAYGEVLFHGDALRVIKSVPVMGTGGFAVEAAAAPAPSAWTARPPRDRWLADPAALDAAFQAMILWSVEFAGGPCLPGYVARYRQFADRFPETGTRVVAKASSRGAAAAADIEFLDERGALVARVEGHESTVDAGLAAAFRRNAVGV